ncbi:hypothetical protein CYQ92_18770 [Escherichia coli]|nr:hypothetical protein CYQ92_18770 [Escherichia coli]
MGCLVEFQIADEVLFVHAGCGVNALSGLQKQYFQQVCRPDKRSASGNLVLSTLMALSFSTL